MADDTVYDFIVKRILGDVRIHIDSNGYDSNGYSPCASPHAAPEMAKSRTRFPPIEQKVQDDQSFERGHDIRDLLLGDRIVHPGSR
jgi:hypothetical protein